MSWCPRRGRCRGGRPRRSRGWRIWSGHDLPRAKTYWSWGSRSRSSPRRRLGIYGIWRPRPKRSFGKFPHGRPPSRHGIRNKNLRVSRVFFRSICLRNRSYVDAGSGTSSVTGRTCTWTQLFSNFFVISRGNNVVSRN